MRLINHPMTTTGQPTCLRRKWRPWVTMFAKEVFLKSKQEIGLLYRTVLFLYLLPLAHDTGGAQH